MTDLSTLVAHLREEADFNKSWVDGRLGGPDSTDDYKARRIEIAHQREQWASAIECLQAEVDRLKTAEANACKRVNELDKALAKAICSADRRVEEERWACARIIQDNIIGHGAGGPTLRPRPDGDVGGLAYASAIRSRTSSQPAVDVLTAPDTGRSPITYGDEVKLREALTHAVAIIEQHVSPNALGRTGGDDDVEWPILDEYLHSMRCLLEGHPRCDPFPPIEAAPLSENISVALSDWMTSHFDWPDEADSFIDEITGKVAELIEDAERAQRRGNAVSDGVSIEDGP